MKTVEIWIQFQRPVSMFPGVVDCAFPRRVAIIPTVACRGVQTEPWRSDLSIPSIGCRLARSRIRLSSLRRYNSLQRPRNTAEIIRCWVCRCQMPASNFSGVLHRKASDAASSEYRSLDTVSESNSILSSAADGHFVCALIFRRLSSNLSGGGILL